jgi:hypothetical protein
LEILGVHPRQNLSGCDPVADVDQKLRYAPGELRVDIDLVGFDTAVA